MDALYGCGASTIWKYIKIICGILSNRQGFFSIYIHAPNGDRLHDIINMFMDVIGLPNIRGAIDDTHIPLTRRPASNIASWVLDFFNMEKFHSIVLQAVCDMNTMFWNICAG
jgi:hypothetical protein